MYVENLKVSGKFLENGEGVFYDDRYTDPVLSDALDDATRYASATGGVAGGAASRMGFGGGGARGGGGRRDRYDDDDDYGGGGFGGFGGGGMSRPGGYPGGRGGASGATAPNLWVDPQSLYPFRIELQFDGVAADKQEPATTRSTTATRRTTGIGFGRRGDD
jgi:hypothetical protein